MKDIKELLNKLHIRYHNLELYTLAVTHPSFNADANTRHNDYERLEFIGDSVIGFICAKYIFTIHPEMDQGEMSKLRSFLVKSSSLAEYARSIDLHLYIRTGHSINPEQLNNSNKILEDVFEAFTAAIFLDLGIGAADKHLRRFLIHRIKKANSDTIVDPKTKLQEEMQAEHREVRYVLIKEEGPAHDRTFTVNVMFEDIVLATGVGKSKKAAEEEAARIALSKRSGI